MPDFALASSGNEGSSKMYQVARNAPQPQRRSVTFNPVLSFVSITADEINKIMRIVSTWILNN